MSFLNRLLKTKKRDTSPQPPSVALRDKDEATLYGLIVSSNDAELREAAVAKLPMGEELINLATGDHSGKIKRLARQQLGVWLDKDTSLVDTLIQRQPKQPLALINLVSCSSNAQERVFATITEEQSLLEIALSGITSSIRQQAAGKIESRACLESLLGSAKSKDKSVAQIARSKLDVFKQADTALAEKQQHAAALCSYLEGLQKRAIDSYLEKRYSELTSEWNALTDEEQAESLERYQAANDNYRLRLEHESQRIQAIQEQEAALEQEKEGILALRQALTALLADVYEAEPLEKEVVQATLAGYAAQVKVLQQANPALSEQCKACYSLREVIESLMLDIEHNGSLPHLMATLEGADEETGKETSKRINQLLRYKKHLTGELPEALQAASKAVKAWSKSLKETAEADSKLLNNIKDLQRRAIGAIDNGRIRQARGIYRELCEKRERHSHLPAGVVRRLDELDEAMQKLGDWYEFAVQPKKQALVEKMEALTQSELQPGDLADRIKSLQDEWKTLSKGGKSQDEDLWQRFQSAADKAFEPCRAFFDEQASEREQNARKREELIAQLQEYFQSYTWESPAWKNVDNILNTAYANWKEYWPVPRKNINTLQEQFDEVMQKILSKLAQAREANHQAKANLITQAESLMEKSDTQSVIEEAKRLQTAWKNLGGTGGRGRSEDQKLWQQFRTACDGIFERRQLEHQAVQEKYSSEREKANSLLKKLDDVLAQTGQDFLEAKKSVAEVQKGFLDVGELPEKEHRKIQGELAQKVEKIEAKAKSERHSERQESWARVYRIASNLSAYEAAVLASGQAGDAETLEELKATIADIKSWPAGTQTLIEQRLKNAESQQIAAGDNEKKLRLLCIRKEISQGKESPAEDKALRMEYQVAQLQQGFGNRSNSKEDGEAMVLEWLAVPGLAEPAYSELYQRFMQG